MCAGPAGYTSGEIIDWAIKLGLDRDQGWDSPPSATNKRVVSNTARGLSHAANIGGSRYAHLAFPGKNSESLKQACPPFLRPGRGGVPGKSRKLIYRLRRSEMLNPAHPSQADKE